MFDAPIVVWLVDSEDSEVRNGWTESSWLTMNIGRAETWPRTVGRALHEIMEIGFYLRHCHYKPHESLTNESMDGYLFIAKHYEFTDICIHAGDMLAQMLPLLAKAYNKVHKGK